MNGEVPVLSNDAFQKICELVYQKSGINLTEQKRSLVLARLQKVLQQNGFQHFNDYLKYLLTDKSGQALTTFINRISTNHTYFNREAQHFAFLKEFVLPELDQKNRANKKTEKIRLWSAGCSTGEEAYQLAMVLSDFFGLTSVHQKAAILATDISTEALENARKGFYAAENVNHLPLSLVKKYFVPLKTTGWQVRPFLKQLVLFKRFNLIRPIFPFKNRFHVIFCRNVMIYFDRKTKDDLIQKFYQFLVPGGYLFIGHSESIIQKNKYFRYVQPAIYQRGE